MEYKSAARLDAWLIDRIAQPAVNRLGCDLSPIVAKLLTADIMLFMSSRIADVSFRSISAVLGSAVSIAIFSLGSWVIYSAYKRLPAQVEDAERQMLLGRPNPLRLRWKVNRYGQLFVAAIVAPAFEYGIGRAFIPSALWVLSFWGALAAFYVGSCELPIGGRARKGRLSYAGEKS